ncbi:MAG: FkbM family methyltransferase [Blastocatellia bacterium]|nr:FkbM family methyltransferase [Blastocatellia bacterium]
MRNALRSVGRFVFGRMMPRAAYPVVRGPLKGARFVLGAFAGAGGGATVYFNQLEPEQTAAMAAEIAPGSLVFDVGANAGYYTILASRLAGPDGRVVAFEPLERNLAYLQRHVEMNRAENVTVLASACSDVSGTATFEIGENIAMGRLSDAAPAGASVTVPTVTLDEIAERLGLTPDVIKLDVEGAEMAVLKGAGGIFERAKPTVFLSTHSNELRTECLAWLEARGYAATPLMGGDDPHEFLLKAR